ncbi:MAG: hypothetical protein ACYDB7_02965 [Mycobacteriales bacterium]
MSALSGRWLEVLDRATRSARVRGMVTLTAVGSLSWWDRALSTAYFAASARAWSGYAGEAAHVAAYRAGLEPCADPGLVLDIGTGAGGSA